MIKYYRIHKIWPEPGVQAGFEDGSKIGNQPDAGNRIQTMSEIRMTRGRVNQVPLGADISPIC